MLDRFIATLIWRAHIAWCHKQIGDCPLNYAQCYAVFAAGDHHA